MGYWKEFQERIGGGIHEPYQDDHVCAYCFGDDALKDFVEANAVRESCTFCGIQGNHPIAAPFLEVIAHMSDYLAREYDTAENSLPYESAEGGYQGTVWTTYELLTDQLELELPNDDDDRLLDALADALGDRAWCDANPFTLADSDRLRMSWAEFCEFIKHRRRFFFMDDHRDPHDELLGPGPIIEAIGRWCQTLHLVADLPPSTKVFRARHKKPRVSLVTARDLGPPREEQATQSNRMSPPGIVMFYVSDDPETGLRETSTAPGTFVVGEFEIIPEVKILDLASLPPVPSIFQELPDSLEYDPRPPLIFLHHFAADISKPIARDNTVHVEYVPTQVITEYFRTNFGDTTAPIMGIRYPSSRHYGHSSIVLFATQEDLLMDNEEPAPFRAREPWLKLVSSRRYVVTQEDIDRWSAETDTTLF